MLRFALAPPLREPLLDDCMALGRIGIHIIIKDAVLGQFWLTCMYIRGSGTGHQDAWSASELSELHLRSLCSLSACLQLKL
jgi:hypothetical protein